MEKTITINPSSTSTQDKKLTQTNQSKKATIQSILEKYNLKTPKKSKTNAVPVEYEIKPKDASQIIHINKSTTSIPSTPSIPSIQNAPPEIKSVPTAARDIKQSISNIPTKQMVVVADAGVGDKSSILEKTKMVSVKELLEKDKAVNEAKKNEMPSAIIQKSSAGSGTRVGSQDKINIYNFIPKVRPGVPEEPTYKQTASANTGASATNYSNSISKGNRNSNNNNSSNIKRVSINPNLNEEESLNYAGNTTTPLLKSINHNGRELAAKVIQEASAARVHAKTPTPLRNIQREQSSEQKRAQPSEQRQIQIQTNTTGGGKQSRALKSIQLQTANSANTDNLLHQKQQMHKQMQIQKMTQAQQQGKIEEMEGENPELRYLEAQRQELQKQQMLELQRFKHKKAAIIKLNNRKKEIELMRSIEVEKNKLRKIHAKQQELNEIYKTAVEKESSSNQQRNLQGGGATMKRLIVNDFDVDAKRTKKNLASMVANKFIEPTDSAHIKGGKLKYTNMIDKIVLEKSEKSEKLKNPVKLENPVKQDNSIVEVVDKVQETQPSENRHTKETTYIVSNDNKHQKEKVKESSKNKIKKELVPGEPLKYYTKKDKQFVLWPSKVELYDSRNFEDKLDVFIGIEPFFNKKQLKNKASPDTINKELKEEYGFQKLNNFKPALLEIIYKIIIGDKIKFTFE